MTDTYLDVLFGLLGAFLSFFLGGLDGLMTVLLVFVVCDQITGLMKGYVLRQWSSEVGFHGIARKVCMFIIVGIANVIDHEMLAKMLGHTEALRDGVIVFYLANEGLSIFENAIELGAPVPEGFKERFLSWRNRHLVSKNTPCGEED